MLERKKTVWELLVKLDWVRQLVYKGTSKSRRVWCAGMGLHWEYPRGHIWVLFLRKCWLWRMSSSG